eukprot:TRINITY_DN17300_c0_g1_i1.p1 TRINITY_DN17300_c0_g1~~TRINITY_DN17300_c0_g1_i1.p1  ORF type:complete len:734 (+),score=48.75 TRINITY_DN17300_c0_g1_i1:274-2475(+)
MEMKNLLGFSQPWTAIIVILIFAGFGMISGSVNSSSEAAEALETDAEALLQFKSSITGDPLGKLSDWQRTSQKNVCKWTGIRCAMSNGQPRVTEISLPQAHLQGTLSPFIANMSSLRILNLYENLLDGSVPNSFGRLSRLKNLYLHSNRHLSGQVPAALFNCSQLETLHLSGNAFFGTVPSNIGRAQALRRLHLGDNYFSGRIPPGLANLSSLFEFDIGHNLLEGNIPYAITQMSSLQELNLNSNSFQGSIPSEISLLNRTLNSLYLNDNRLSGSLPSSIYSLSDLRELGLRGNDLSGEISPDIKELQLLEHIDLSRNRLSGSIPQEFQELPEIHLYLDLSSNNLRGEIPELIMTRLVLTDFVDLSNNHLSGDIFARMPRWSGMTKLNLSFNSFSGTPNKSLSIFSELKSLDLSHNKFSGPLPSLPDLSFLNLSYNDFQGNIPCQQYSKKFNRTSFLQNPDLCGDCFGFPTCSELAARKAWLTVLDAAAAILLVCAVVSLLVIYLRGKRRSSVKLLPLAELHSPFSEAELRKATDNFSPKKFLGNGSNGSVYRGDVPEEGTVAVKAFDDLDEDDDDDDDTKMQGAECFLNDCLRLRKIRHRNLVKIISVCYRKGFKALVMEYMPNGSLQRLLHEKNNQNYKMESRLSLRRRLKILKEVATGLCYLHNHCKPPIIHSDVNPRNVFFDESMTAKLSDFGMSDLLWESFIAKNATINGTLGYIPPGKFLFFFFLAF